jgi:hypothetical protein
MKIDLWILYRLPLDIFLIICILCMIKKLMFVGAPVRLVDRIKTNFFFFAMFRHFPIAYLIVSK